MWFRRCYLNEIDDRYWTASTFTALKRVQNVILVKFGGIPPSGSGDVV